MVVTFQRTQIPGLLPLNQNSDTLGPIMMGPFQKVVPLYIGLLTTVFLFIVYIEKKADHVRIIVIPSFVLGRTTGLSPFG